MTEVEKAQTAATKVRELLGSVEHQIAELRDGAARIAKELANARAEGERLGAAAERAHSDYEREPILAEIPENVLLIRRLEREEVTARQEVEAKLPDLEAQRQKLRERATAAEHDIAQARFYEAVKRYERALIDGGIWRMAQEVRQLAAAANIPVMDSEFESPLLNTHCRSIGPAVLELK